MKTDIQIAQEAVLEPITEVAKQLQISEDELELYGKYKAKISDDFMEKIKDNPDGKLILVTAINPTPAGEGKTTTSVGLGQAFGKLGKKAVIALREPSLGPCFGVKGGAAGGGYAQVVPMEDLNLHFTGDFHAITSANNLLAAMLDNHIQQGNELQIDTRSVVWKRCLDMNDRVYKTAREKYNAVIDEIQKMRESGRPTLVGTTSVEISELLSKMLNMRKIPHQVLNAKLHQKEADIVALAGQSTNGLGAVTIATNMAGRGTDIKLSPEVKAAGGLAIIGTERHESRRVDRQLRGRSGRQGDPGSSIFYVSLEDKLMRLFASERIARLMDRIGLKDGEVIEHSIVTKSIERAQRKVEENNFGIRKRLLEYDDVMNKQRTVIYEKRRHALMGERLGMDISNTLWDRIVNIIENNDYEGCKEEFIHIFSMEVPFTEEQFINEKHEKLCEDSFQMAMDTFKRKSERIQTIAMPIIQQVYEQNGENYERIMVPITDGQRIYNIPCNLKEAYETQCKSIIKQFEKVLILHIIDDCWKENLRELDELKHSVQNASYEQKDPLLIFKLESVKLFDSMVNNMNNRITSILMRAGIPELQQSQSVQEAEPERQPQRPSYVESKQNLEEDRLTDQNQVAASRQDTRARQPQTPIVKDKLPGRNDPCPCGSGKKFKNCHGKGLV